MAEAFFKVPVLLEKLPGELVWTAQIPYVENCVSEGNTPELATTNLVEAIAALATVDLSIYDKLANPPQYLLTQIEIQPKKQ